MTARPSCPPRPLTGDKRETKGQDCQDGLAFAVASARESPEGGNKHERKQENQYKDKRELFRLPSGFAGFRPPAIGALGSVAPPCSGLPGAAALPIHISRVHPRPVVRQRSDARSCVVSWKPAIAQNLADVTTQRFL